MWFPQTPIIFNERQQSACNNAAGDAIAFKRVHKIKSDCALLGGETAEMPGVYADGEVDVVGTIVGIVDKAKVIDGQRITAGDVVIGLPSASPHTNGYSLIRHILADTDLSLHDDALGDIPLDLLPNPQFLTPFTV